MILLTYKERYLIKNIAKGNFFVKVNQEGVTAACLQFTLKIKQTSLFFSFLFYCM